MDNLTMSESLNGFAFKLFDAVSAGNSKKYFSTLQILFCELESKQISILLMIDENFFISPFSILTAMTMCYVGARANTSKQLKELLNFESLNDHEILKLSEDLLNIVNTKLGTDVRLNVCNKIYLNVGFGVKKDFLDNITNIFHAEVQQVDYSDPVKSSQTINDWVASKTNNKIQNLISPDSINALVRLILVNAIYFKGNWLDKFDAQNTSPEDFNLADGSKVKVNTMKLHGKYFNVMYDIEGLDATFCKIPYAGEKISMTIILPNEGVSLNDVEKQMNSKMIHDVLGRKFYREKVNVHLPKFKMEYEIEVFF